MPLPPVEIKVRQDSGEAFAEVRESHRDGAARIYTALIGEERIQSLAQDCLAELARSVSLPGFVGGKGPQDLLEQRYGAQARGQALRRLGADVVKTGLPEGSVAHSCALVSGAESGPAEIHIQATHLPDLPAPDFHNPPLQRIAIATCTPAKEAFVRDHLKKQVLDRLDSVLPIPLFPGIVDREFSALWRCAESAGALPEAREERTERREQLRSVAGRRLRLGYLMLEFARRFGIAGTDGLAVENRVVECFLSQAAVTEREPTASELAEMPEC